MSVVSVQPKDFILALFIRDDGERFLLGDNGYDFMDSQLHFSANTIENDEVEKQGADGTMLAGQVRRASVQTFDGYVGDATTPKEEIEQMRRAFIAFFLKGHHYRVIYVDCARNAWQRKGGYLVDAPEVKELFQVHPEYHVGLNFEDVNYYSYDENAEGDEITANLVQVAISSAVEGGLVWDEDGAVSEDAVVEYDGDTATASGTSITVSDAVEAPLSDFKLKGETSQQTYSGKNLLPNQASSTSTGGITMTKKADGSMTFNGTTTASAVYFNLNQSESGYVYLESGKTYTLSTSTPMPSNTRLCCRNATGSTVNYIDIYGGNQTSKTTTMSVSDNTFTYFAVYNIGTAVNNLTIYPMLEQSATATAYEPYVGGVPAPNPDYPQAVKTVTGENVVKISDGQGNEQSYEINLGKNLWGGDGIKQGTWNVEGTTSRVTLFLPCKVGDTYAFTNPDPTAYKVDFGITTSPIQGSSTQKTETGWKQESTTIYTCGYDGFFFVQASKVDNSNFSVADSKAVAFQLEKGSTATPYAAYFAPIELCKIGDYQDSIYKSGDDWYVHKETNKKTYAASDFTLANNDNYTNVRYAQFAKPEDNIQYGNYDHGSIINYFTAARNMGGMPSGGWDSFNAEGEVYNNATRTAWWCSFPKTTSLDTIKTKLNGMTVYYALATPTDTEITNEALVAQLEAILSQGSTYAGTNNITTVISAGNEQGELEVEYYTRYEFEITAGGYEWEQGGSGGPTTVMNESIDNVYPIWTITGPITNPVLENTTTGEQIEYVGTIGDGQTLVIDMGAQTALLDGLNVVANIVGEFLSLAPGSNTLIYSVDSGDKASEIGWSEIVG